jgi:cysteine desulfurase
MREIYFDNAATTPCSASVITTMNRIFTTQYGNPSSLHRMGLAAENCIKTAQNQISQTLKVKPNEIIFTSGGTEADNLAIIGAALANQRAGKHIITTTIEHPAVRAAIDYLAEQGFTIQRLSVDAMGQISLTELAELITTETILVSMMHVNNEIGTVIPIEAVAQIIKEHNPAAIFHVDAIQSYGKYLLLPQRQQIDLLSASGHKIHGPKGVGFLYVKEKTKIKPLLYGGGQQRGIRSGTENVPGIAGLGEAAKVAYQALDQTRETLYQLREAFIHGLTACPWAHINGACDRRSAPHILSVSFDKVPSEVLLHALEERGIYVSAGSACASNKPALSETLQAIGLPREYQKNTIRFSFSTDNTLTEVETCLQQLRELVPMLMRYQRH